MAGFAPALDPRLLAHVPASLRPLYRQDYGETLLRYAPQQNTLLALLGQTEGDYQQKVAQANAAADLIGNAALTQQRSLPAPYQAPGNPLMALLSQRGVQAAQGAKYQITGYGSQRDSDVAKIGGQLSDLGNQAATYFSTRADQLVSADRKQRHDTNLANKRIAADLRKSQLSAATTKRGQDITVRGQDLSHQDRQAALAARGKKAQNPFLAPNQQATQVARVKGAQKSIAQLMSHPDAQQPEVETLLRAGKVDGVKYTQPQIDVAFDLWRHNGKLSSRGVRVLHGTLKTQARGNFPLLPRRLARGQQQAVVGALKNVGL